MRVTKAVLETRVADLQAQLLALESVEDDCGALQAELKTAVEEIKKLKSYVVVANTFGAELVSALTDADELFAQIQRNISVTGFFNPRNTAKMPRELQRSVKLLRRDIYQLVGPEEEATDA